MRVLGRSVIVKASAIALRLSTAPSESTPASIIAESAVSSWPETSLKICNSFCTTSTSVSLAEAVFLLSTFPAWLKFCFFPYRKRFFTANDMNLLQFSPVAINCCDNSVKLWCSMEWSRRVWIIDIATDGCMYWRPTRSIRREIPSELAIPSPASHAPHWIDSFTMPRSLQVELHWSNQLFAYV